MQPVAAACGVAHCTPSSCGVPDHVPCRPDLRYPFGVGLRAVESRPQELPARPSDHPLDTLQELYAAIGRCWIPPPLDQARPGTQITIRFSLTRSGEILGEPLYTYSTPSLPTEIKAAYQQAVAATLRRCTPFHLSDGLGGAIAGRPISTRFIDSRAIRRRERDI